MKRGFTLVELLATIVVLAVISLITVPMITGVIEKTKKGAFKDSVYELFDAASIYYAQHMTEHLINNELIFVCDSEKCKTQSNGELKFKGQVPESGKIIYNPKGYTEALFIKIGKYCASGNINNLEIEKDCYKLDKTKADVSVSQGTITSKSIMVGVNAVDVESKIKKIEYIIDGKTYIDDYDDIEVNTSKTFNDLKANKEYTIKVIVTNGNNVKNTKEIKITTKDLGILTIKYNNNPTTAVNDYLKSQEAYLEYSGNDAVGYYIKSERRATSDKNAIKLCGSGTIPAECSDIAALKNLESNNWYYFSSSPKLTYNETSTEVSNIYAIATNGISNTALTSGVISKIDVTGPNAPSIYIWDIAGTAKNSGDWSKDGVWTSARTTDVGSGIAYYQYSHDNVTFHNDISTLGWTYNYENANTKERLDYLINWSGQWTFYVRAVDKLGNIGSSSAAFIERVDADTPTITNGSVSSNSNTVSLGYVVNDATFGKSVTVTCVIGGVQVAASTTGCSRGGLAASTNYAFTVTVTDPVGHSATWSGTRATTAPPSCANRVSGDSNWTATYSYSNGMCVITGCYLTGRYCYNGTVGCTDPTSLYSSYSHNGRGCVTAPMASAQSGNYAGSWGGALPASYVP